jgi:hypothetical protein
MDVIPGQAEARKILLETVRIVWLAAREERFAGAGLSWIVMSGVMPANIKFHGKSEV